MHGKYTVQTTSVGVGSLFLHLLAANFMENIFQYAFSTRTQSDSYIFQNDICMQSGRNRFCSKVNQ